MRSRIAVSGLGLGLRRYGNCPQFCEVRNPMVLINCLWYSETPTKEFQTKGLQTKKVWFNQIQTNES